MRVWVRVCGCVCARVLARLGVCGWVFVGACVCVLVLARMCGCVCGCV